ncbi:MAG: Omp28-related outer membrane protein, partial [Prevotella sp.]|nr:Omp28-related outer membrane protein [Prevotella sp.]
GTDLYVGYEETGLQYLSYPARAKDGTEYYCTPLGSGWQTYTQYYAAGILITVEGDDLPLYDVSLDSSIMPDYVVTGEPYASSHSITNKGLATVESVELTYTVGDEQYTETIEGLDIANGESGYFTAETVLFDEEGEDNVTVSITKINGNNDRDTSDNASRTVNVISRKEFVQRNMLVEMFSTMNCKDCPEGDEAVMAIIADMDNVVQVCHHTADGYDDYTISESEQYQWFYKHNAFAPSVMLDRTCLYNEVPYSYTKPNNNFYADSPVIGTGNAFNSDLFHIQAAKPAYATVNITTALDDSTVKVNISGNKILTIDEDKEYHLTVFVVEDSLITTKQNGYTGKFVYNGSPRLALSDAWGDEIDLVNGYDKDYEFTLSDEWDINHVRVVAFVGEYDEYDKCGHRVLNTAQAWLVEKEEEGETTAIENAAAAADAVRVAGNTIILPEGTTQLDIFNAAGLLLTSTAPTGNAYALSGLGAGVYVARVKTAAGVQTVKFTVF